MSPTPGDPAFAPPFDRRAALRFGWEGTKRHLGPFVGVMLLSWAIALFAQGLREPLGGAPALRALVSLVEQLAQSVVTMGMLRMALAVRDGRAPRLRDDLRPDWSRWLDYVAAMLLYGLIVAAGMVLLIVPGVYFAIRYGLAGFLVVDRAADPASALHHSAALTEGARGKLFLFGLTLIGLNLLGALALGIGLLLTLPTSLLASAHVYRQLLAREEAPAPLVPAPV